MMKSVWHKHPAVIKDNSIGARASDVLKHWFGTWTALGAVLSMMVVWITMNRTGVAHFDPFPFILLNLVLSCIAAVQGIILQISANRGDVINSQVALHTEQNTTHIVELEEKQMELLQGIDDIKRTLVDWASTPQPKE